MRKPHATRKLSVAKAGKVQHQVQVCVDQRTTDNIASARASYKAILGRSVSTSVVMRRGVDLLARHLQQVHGEERTKDELSYLMRSVR